MSLVTRYQYRIYQPREPDRPLHVSACLFASLSACELEGEEAARFTEQQHGLPPGSLTFQVATKRV